MDVLLLRLDAPLMSFGGVVVDQHNKTDRFPYRAMLTGLVANALGWTRAEADPHERLQRRLRYAARIDRSGGTLVDYQTVDFDPGGPMASRLGWTTHGRLEERGGGSASDATHIRLRHYLEDAVVTVAMTLVPADESPDLGAVADALQRPARPLFIGRKCCVPSTPILRARVVADSLRTALERAPRDVRAPEGVLRALWPSDEGGDSERTISTPRVEDRDWVNSIHVGRRIYVEGNVEPPRTIGEGGS